MCRHCRSFPVGLLTPVPAGWSAMLVAVLSLLLLGQARSDYVGQSVAGVVGEGNYTYYSLRQPGRVRLRLVTTLGESLIQPGQGGRDYFV